ncbi:S8 family serine peptidase [Methylomarinum vadi]|uniref:S8 family serine peptidase n=1 Tax=Methylomarinum vadi TaxID=438855 RepID=UPI00068E2EA0
MKSKNIRRSLNRSKQVLKTGVAVCLASVSCVTAVNAAPEKPWKTGQILVKPRAGLPANEFKNILKRSNARAIEAIGALKVHVISVPENAEEAVVRALSKNPHIEFAELDMAVEPSEMIPNDPKFSSAWHLPKIQAPTAWETSIADGITIAVLDTGVDATHPDLSGKLLAGWNAVDGSNSTSDVNGHGTAVAGTAAASSNNATGVASVAWNAQILPVRITNRSDSYAYWSDVARGLNWAADHGADVANISYAVSNSSSVSSAAQYMRSKGGVVVVAAGNDGTDPGYSDNPYMISVSATTSTDAKASWSNYGAFIDVAAPGSSILTTTRGGGYGNWNGTSFSSPAAAGVVALIMGANPTLTPDEIEQVLEGSADKIAGDWHPYYGNGRVNAATAVQMAMNMDNTPVDNQAPSVNIFSPVGGDQVSGIVQVEVNASDDVGVNEVSLYANNQLVGTDGTAPYQFSWDSEAFADGDVVLTAYADDAAGNQGTSNDVSVTVKNLPDVVDQNAPSVAISNPADGSTVSRTVTISVSAEDDVQVARVSLYIDGVLMGSVNGNSLDYSWNTRKVSDGSHTIEAVAVDTANKSSQQAIQVNVGSSTNNKSSGRGNKKK